MNNCKLCGEYIPPMYEHTHECRKSFNQSVGIEISPVLNSMFYPVLDNSIQSTPIDNSSYDAPSSDNYDSGSSSSDLGGGSFGGSGADGDY